MLLDKDYEQLMIKYKRRLQKDFGLTPKQVIQKRVSTSSREYLGFKKEYLPRPHSFYEKACQFCQNILSIKPNEQKLIVLEEAIRISHLDIEPGGVLSFSVMTLVLFMGIGIPFGLLTGSLYFMTIFMILGISSMLIVQKYPVFAANGWRMKASNQMVLCIFYIVTYMRHTSNLEHAIEFASQHLKPPLSLDMKKILWDVETEKYESIKESLDLYLETWRKWNREFIEAMHLVEGSLYEPSNTRRISMLDKSLDIILDETYEKMLHYAHNLKSPITMLHMLGVILPILGLVILPLMVSFMGGVKWYHIAVIYNIFLPLIVFNMGKNILSTRPTGYGDGDISESDPVLKKYRNIVIRLGPLELVINPLWIALTVGITLILIGLLPVIIPKILPGMTEEGSLFVFRVSKENPNKMIGPFGLAASVLSLGVVLAFGVGLGVYYRLRSKNIIEIRNRSKELEEEFAGSLFQLGNRIGDGIPLELAFMKVAEVSKGTRSGSFFQLVSGNITRLGMSVEQALFDRKHGALTYFPSPVIESAMKVLLVSAAKGPLVASQAVISVSRYIKEIHKVNERLKDLLGDVISSMKAQVSFLAPAIAGIVVGITAMVTTILGKLGVQMDNLSKMNEAATQTAALGEFFGDSIPTYYFQIIVGIYVIQMIFILTILVNGIENGSDKLMEKYLLGQNLVRSTILYSVISVTVIVIFSIVASSIMTVSGGVGL